MNIQLRDYQQYGVNSFKRKYNKNPQQLKGRFVIPTGGGKTVLEGAILSEMIDKDGNNIHLVLAPRIVLVNQLKEEFRKFYGDKCHVVVFHSGKDEPDPTKIKWDVKSTTNPHDIQEEINRAHGLHRMGLSETPDLVIFSTYHSAHKLTEFQFDTVIADESQYCIVENFFNTINDLNAHVKLFFTATERVSMLGAQRSNDNVDVFGPIIYQITSSKLINGGWIVPPKLHCMYANKMNDADTFINEVIHMAKFQSDHTNLDDRKILFACKGTDPVRTVLDHLPKIRKNLPEYDVFTILSNPKYGSMINGEKVKRTKFMAELKNAKNALIFHYDILSEGIDVSGITGVVIMREMHQAKLLQTIGRALRTHKIGGIELKKHAVVSVPVIDGDNENRNFVQKMVCAIRDGGFEINAESILYSNAKVFGINDDNPLTDDSDSARRARPQTILMNIFDEIEEIESYAEIDAMPDDEMIMLL